jgi:hypothetical protein
MHESLLEPFNDLSRLYLKRELLISKLADGREITLSESEKRVDALIEDKDLLKLVKMLDEFFAIRLRSKDSVKIVRSYRNRLNQFIDHTIGLKEYSFLLSLNKEELKKMLEEDKEKLLKRKDLFPILEGQLLILLRWFGRGVRGEKYE